MSSAVESASLPRTPVATLGATERLHGLMRQRDTLLPPFRSTWELLAARHGADELEAWSSGVLALADVNAGPSCLLSFWQVSRNFAAADGLAALTSSAVAAANICRQAGAQAAAATITALPVARQRLGDVAALPRWWQIMEDLSREAAESVEALASRIGQVLRGGDLDALQAFIAAGLKLASGNKRRRLAFFTLRDELARRLVERSAAATGFAETERQTKAFVTSLWGRPALLRSFAVDTASVTQRRSAIAGPLIRLPDYYRGSDGEAARALYRAAVAHAQAHFVYGGPRFPVGSLKPLQTALVTLIEDARVETLAMRQLPGLRRLWSPYHVAHPDGVATAPVLLARLARALFDPAYQDADGFVSKGRQMFDAAGSHLADPALSREIGMLLGNDLGQMRVQFNAKTYCVEPLYRDDGLGLWDFGEQAPSSTDQSEMAVDAARPTPQEDREDENHNDRSNAPSAGRGRPTPADQRGSVIAKYPEWDRRARIERPEWTTVREVAANSGDVSLIEEALSESAALRLRISQLVRGIRVGRTVRLTKQFDGHDLDIDAMLEAGMALRMRRDPDPRIYRSSSAGPRDLAVLLLIDISESTKARLASGASILDVERLAVAVLAEAMNALGDPFCLLAFASNGRDDVKMTTVKAFDEAYDRACVGRLAGLSSGLSTRLGTALRHAGETIRRANCFRKLVIVLTDGEPSDIDVEDPLELIEDARRAATSLKSAGIDGFGVVLDPAGIGSAATIFGRGNTMLVHRLEDLPKRLSELYFRLARR